MDIGDLLDKYRQKTPEEAEEHWIKMYRESVDWDRCMLTRISSLLVPKALRLIYVPIASHAFAFPHQQLCLSSARDAQE